jgi:Glycosyl transferase family 2
MSETIERTAGPIADRLSRGTKALPSASGRLPGRTAEWFTDATQPRITAAVLIPCYNEETSIGKVIADFRAALPDATIYVYDNNSTDRTVTVARAAGALVRTETLQGKGHVVRRMFADIEADIYVLVDGDDTYDARAAPAMTKLLLERRLDMVSAARDTPAPAAYRLGHKLGNAILSGMVRYVFGRGIDDMLSGYRVFNRRFVKSFPALASGFETETEFTVHALALHMPVAEIYAPYRSRPPGSHSKLNTYADGFRILREIVALIERERPLTCAAAMTAILLALAMALGLPVIIAFLHTGTVDRLPTAVLSASIVLLASLTLGCGLILDTVTHGRKELKRLSYLAIPFPPGY